MAIIDNAYTPIKKWSVGKLDYISNRSNNRQVKKQLKRFLDNPENQKFQKVDYIAIHTGYTDRIIEHSNVLHKIKPDIVFNEASKDSPEHYIGNADAYAIVSKLTTYDKVVFESSTCLDVINYIEILFMAQYCGGCYISHMYEMKWYEVDGKIILLCFMDTESG